MLSVLTFSLGKHTAGCVCGKEHFQRELVHHGSDLMKYFILWCVHNTIVLFGMASGWSLIKGSRSVGHILGGHILSLAPLGLFVCLHHENPFATHFYQYDNLPHLRPRINGPGHDRGNPLEPRGKNTYFLFLSNTVIASTVQNISNIISFFDFSVCSKCVMRTFPVFPTAQK